MMEAPILVRDIIKHVSRVFDIPVNEIISHRRKAPLSRARQAAMYLAKTLTTKSYPEIGRMIGGRDHSTVIHGCAVCEEWMRRDRVYRARVRWARRLALTSGVFVSAPKVEPVKDDLTIDWQTFAANLPEIAPPQPDPVPWFERPDDQLLTEAVRRFYAKGGSFVEVRS